MPERYPELHGKTVQLFELVDNHTEITFTDGTKVIVKSYWDGSEVVPGVSTYVEVINAP